MSPRTFLVSLLALIFGGSAALGVRAMMSSPRAAGPVDTVKVVVAAADIPRGSKLTRENLVLRDFPRSSVSPGVATRIEDVLDRGAAIPLVAGEPLHESKLISKGGLPVQEGWRAVTIQTPTVAAGVAGFVLPGDWVDVLLTLQGKGQNDPTGGGSASTLLQNVKVLAVDQEISAPESGVVADTKMRMVTLEVLPQQAKALILGSSEGTLTLVLRNPKDTISDTSKEIYSRELLGRPQGASWGEQARSVVESIGKTLREARAKAAAEPPAAEAAQPLKAIRLIRGGNNQSRAYIDPPPR